MTKEEMIAEAESVGYECRWEDGWLLCDHPRGARVGVSNYAILYSLYGDAAWRHELATALKETSQ